jgi:hypothetical protein
LFEKQWSHRNIAVCTVWISANLRFKCKRYLDKKPLGGSDWYNSRTIPIPVYGLNCTNDLWCQRAKELLHYEWSCLKIPIGLVVRGGVMVFNATFNIFQLYRGGNQSNRRKPATCGNSWFYHKMLHRIDLVGVGIELTTVCIGTLYL